jgi:hypothetical protein
MLLQLHDGSFALYRNRKRCINLAVFDPHYLTFTRQVNSWRKLRWHPAWIVSEIRQKTHFWGDWEMTRAWRWWPLSDLWASPRLIRTLKASENCTPGHVLSAGNTKGLRVRKPQT